MNIQSLKTNATSSIEHHYRDTMEYWSRVLARKCSQRTGDSFQCILCTYTIYWLHRLAHTLLHYILCILYSVMSKWGQFPVYNMHNIHCMLYSETQYVIYDNIVTIYIIYTVYYTVKHYT